MVGNCWFVLIKKAFRFWAVFITYSPIIHHLVFELKSCLEVTISIQKLNCVYFVLDFGSINFFIGSIWIQFILLKTENTVAK